MLVAVELPWLDFAQSRTRSPISSRRALRSKQSLLLVRAGALGGSRTPNLLIRSQMLYPLSYEREKRPV